MCFGLRLSRFICGLISVSFLRLFVWARLKKVVRFDVCFFVYVRVLGVNVCMCVCVWFLIKRGKYERK